MVQLDEDVSQRWVDQTLGAWRTKRRTLTGQWKSYASAAGSVNKSIQL